MTQRSELTVVDLVAVARFATAADDDQQSACSWTSHTGNLPGAALIEDLAFKAVDQLKLEAEQTPEEAQWPSLEVGAGMEGLAAVARARGLTTTVASSLASSAVAAAVAGAAAIAAAVTVAAAAEDGEG